MALPILSDSKSYDAAVQIVSKLNSEGYIAYFAGGCVRDALEGKTPSDIDIATNAHPDAVQKLFRKTIPVGVQFGVVRVRDGDFEYEVATFRTDGPYLDGRRPSDVAFSTAEQDALRRDFTVNGMFYDPLAGEVIDFVGGQSDLHQRIVRAIGEPALRFKEDRLRLIRAIRFAAKLEFEIEHGTWEAIRSAAPEISLVSMERVRDELIKILGDRNRVRGFDLMDRSCLLAVVLPEVDRLKGVEQPEKFHPEGDVFVHTRKMLSLLEPGADGLLAMAVLLHDIGKPLTQTFEEDRIRFNGHDRVGAEMAERTMERLRFSRAQIQLVVEAVRQHMVFKDVQQMRPARLKRFMARPTFELELELHRVDCMASHGDIENHTFLSNKKKEFAHQPLIPEPLLRGDDLLALGLDPGPEIGRLLNAVQTAQLEGEIKTRKEALELVRSVSPDLSSAASS
ncbi:MAG: CCA tRNA nucleotidyltransferase [Verrucomicrobia bacterium]|nr:CCA tRNA nucleotidyltransferase [Verrucomicrobiota bacterium]